MCCCTNLTHVLYVTPCAAHSEANPSALLLTPRCYTIRCFTKRCLVDKSTGVLALQSRSHIGRGRQAGSLRHIYSFHIVTSFQTVPDCKALPSLEPLRDGHDSNLYMARGAFLRGSFLALPMAVHTVHAADAVPASSAGTCRRIREVRRGGHQEYAVQAGAWRADTEMKISDADTCLLTSMWTVSCHAALTATSSTPCSSRPC
jgi:hypothetical protein